MAAPFRAVNLHERISAIRAFEEVVAEAHAAGTLPGLLHLSIGGAVVVQVTAGARGTGGAPHEHTPQSLARLVCAANVPSPFSPLLLGAVTPTIDRIVAESRRLERL